jgi:lambda repressor-like predicted transcriptional regulator
MLATKNSLGIWDIDDKEKGRGEGLLASQTKVKDSPIKKEIINQPTKKVNEMAKVKATKDTHVADAVKEFREIGQSMKDGATRRANIRARLKEMGIAIDEDGKIDV